MWRLGSKFVNVMSITFVGNLAPGKFIEPRDANPAAYTWRIDLGAFYAIQQIVIPRRPDLGLIHNINEYLISLSPPPSLFLSLPPSSHSPCHSISPISHAPFLIHQPSHTMHFSFNLSPNSHSRAVSYSAVSYSPILSFSRSLRYTT